MLVKELVRLLEPAVNGDLPVTVRCRIAADESQLLEITTIVITLEPDTAEDAVVIECGG